MICGHTARRASIANRLCLLLLVLLPCHVAATAENLASLQARWVSAISNDKTSSLQQMLSGAGDDAGLVGLGSANGKTALMVACKRGEFQLAKKLVAAGADIHQRTLTGGTAFMFAVLGNNADIARWLQAKGADIDSRGSNGWSAVTIAAAKGHADILLWLIEQGAATAEPDVYRMTPLMRAVDNGHRKVVDVLLATAQPEVNFRDEQDNTAMHYAVANRHYDLVRVLLRHGADAGATNRVGLTPMAMATGDERLLALLREGSTGK